MNLQLSGDALVHDYDEVRALITLVVNEPVASSLVLMQYTLVCRIEPVLMRSLVNSLSGLNKLVSKPVQFCVDSVELQYHYDVPSCQDSASEDCLLGFRGRLCQLSVMDA